MRKILFVYFFTLLYSVSAQNISVASFKLLENDLTANTVGTMERDQNGEPAALIKVVTTEQGFVFDGGMTGIVKTKQEVGEVWVYVPHGIKKITVKHSQLGVLRDYYLPVSIEKAKTYEMVLTTGRVETMVTHSVNKQFVVFYVKPTDAVVDFNEEVLTVDGAGVAQKLVPYGTYDYRVTHPNYHVTAGKVTVNAQGKAEVNVTLRPNFGWISVSGNSEYDGAYVYIDNERVGQLPFTSGELKSGTHRVKVVKSMYKTYEQQVTVSDNETTELNVQLVANFANVTLKADEGSEIYIDGQRKGNAQWQGPLEIGEYVVEVRKPSHHSSSEIVRITGSEERTIQLKSPKPIYTSIEITSTPSNAMVYIDGVESGTTPLFKNDVLVGAHRLEFRKEGYGLVEKSVNLQEGTENRVAVELTNQQEVNIVSTPSGSDVSIDGVYKGVTPLKIVLEYGNHTLRFAKNGYETASKTIDVNSQTTTINQMLSLKSQTVEIASSPSGASVEVDGRYKGVTPFNEILTYGNHTIRFTKDGYNTVSKTIDVNSQTSNISQMLSSESQKIEITSSPSGASIEVDGMYKGSTPLNISLTSGQHLISLSKNGYNSLSVKKTVSALKDERFHFELKKIKKDLVQNFNPDKKLWCFFGGGLGYSASHGFNIGMELGINYNLLYVSLGFMHHHIGDYSTYCVDYRGNYWGETVHSVASVHTFCDLGLSLQVGNSCLITPLIELICLTGFPSGQEYIMGDVPYATPGGTGEEGLNPNIDYSELNASIVDLMDSRCQFALGTRFELFYKEGARIGLYVSPKYIFQEGFFVSGGLVVAF